MCRFPEHAWLEFLSHSHVKFIEHLNTRGEEQGAARRFLVTRNTETIDSGQTVACNLEWLLKHILS